jgi:hypothetical protein
MEFRCHSSNLNLNMALSNFAALEAIKEGSFVSETRVPRKIWYYRPRQRVETHVRVEMCHIPKGKKVFAMVPYSASLFD